MYVCTDKIWKGSTRPASHGSGKKFNLHIRGWKKEGKCFLTQDLFRLKFWLLGQQISLSRWIWDCHRLKYMITLLHPKTWVPIYLKMKFEDFCCCFTCWQESYNQFQWKLHFILVSSLYLVNMKWLSKLSAKYDSKITRRGSPFDRRPFPMLASPL